MKIKLLLGFVLLLMLSIGVSAQTVSGGFSKSRVSKGSVARGFVILKIPKGLHVNSYRPTSKNLIATKLTVSGKGVSTFGITYPPGKMKKFSFSRSKISVYENRAYMGFKVRVPKNYRGRTIRVKASVRYQACTDEVCYRPETKSVWLTARVR